MRHDRRGGRSCGTRRTCEVAEDPDTTLQISDTPITLSPGGHASIEVGHPSGGSQTSTYASTATRSGRQQNYPQARPWRAGPRINSARASDWPAAPAASPPRTYPPQPRRALRPGPGRRAVQRRCCSNNNSDPYETAKSFYQTFFPVCAIRLPPGRRINRAERIMSGTRAGCNRNRRISWRDNAATHRSDAYRPGCRRRPRRIGAARHQRGRLAYWRTGRTCGYDESS